MMQFTRKVKDIGITGKMAYWYDKNTRENRLAEMRSYAQEISSHIKDGASILEVAPGPGYMAISLAKMGNYKITGMDISEDFVSICKSNAKTENVSVEFVQGNVSQMPFSDEAFDFIFCSAAFKNFKEPKKALQEMRRVLKQNGIILIIDMNKNATNKARTEELNKMGMKGLDRFFVGLSFKTFLRSAAYTKESFAKIINDVNISNFEIKETGISLYVYIYKK
jgi:ubiquinone/menaquinone biosynthesis C-methylase UbiE